jgi:hypothetical protein
MILTKLFKSLTFKNSQVQQLKFLINIFLKITSIIIICKISVIIGIQKIIMFILFSKIFIKVILNNNTLKLVLNLWIKIKQNLYGFIQDISKARTLIFDELSKLKIWLLRYKNVLDLVVLSKNIIQLIRKNMRMQGSTYLLYWLV